jgi:hypothetical protein
MSILSNLIQIVTQSEDRSRAQASELSLSSAATMGYEQTVHENIMTHADNLMTHADTSLPPPPPPSSSSPDW